ncbi:MAG: 3D-(3,5/4)-trihydroxycyclohexane-1,2-dione acylhydrolase (decyclizing) [Gammaproteobacteria bacterium]
MKKIKLTAAQALVKWMTAQHIHNDESKNAKDSAPLFAGVFAIFGHGNVTCLGEALFAARKKLPVWRGQNEQSMALAAVAFAKAKRRRQIMAATSSIGPGATNMITAAACAHVNRLPVFLLAGDSFANRLPDPVLQQVENFGDPTITVNDSFRAVCRYWDRINHPAQLIPALSQAAQVMLDPAECGPAFLALPQDVQAMAYDYPAAMFDKTTHNIRRPRPDRQSIKAAAEVLTRAKKPLVIAGGGAHYSLATAEVCAFAKKHGLPVAETVAGRGCLRFDNPQNVGPIGVIGSASANNLAADADAVIAIGTRLQDFSTGSWSIFANPQMRLITINTARFDAHKHRAAAVIGDAKECITELSAALGKWKAGGKWQDKARKEYRLWNKVVKAHTDGKAGGEPSYAEVIGIVNNQCDGDDMALTAAGGFPGEFNKVWQSKRPGDFDCEFGYSCMGYEIAGGFGARMARDKGEVFVLVGDGSYLMMNSEILSAVMTGRKLIIIVCDNGGYAIINRLQNFKGGASFNNLFEHCRGREVPVDFVSHAKSMGANGEQVRSLADLTMALKRARQNKGTYVIAMRTAKARWTPGDAWWDVGVPEVSPRKEVRKAKTTHEKTRPKQRRGM